MTGRGSAWLEGGAGLLGWAGSETGISARFCCPQPSIAIDKRKGIGCRRKKTTSESLTQAHILLIPPVSMKLTNDMKWTNEVYSDKKVNILGRRPLFQGAA